MDNKEATTCYKADDEYETKCIERGIMLNKLQAEKQELENKLHELSTEREKLQIEGIERLLNIEISSHPNGEKNIRDRIYFCNEIVTLFNNPINSKTIRPSEKVVQLDRIINLGNSFIKAIKNLDNQVGIPQMTGALSSLTLDWNNKVKSMQSKDPFSVYGFLDLTKELRDKLSTLKTGNHSRTMRDAVFSSIGYFYIYLTGKRPTLTYNPDNGKYSGTFLSFCKIFIPKAWDSSEFSSIIKRLFPPGSNQG